MHHQAATNEENLHQTTTDPLRILDLNTLEEAKRDNVNQFVEKFQHRTGKIPHYVVCAPGRVNLIGDHIDYHGFSVLPMAIKSSIRLGCFIGGDNSSSLTNTESAVESSSPMINLVNTDEANFPVWCSVAHSFTYGFQLDKSYQWQNYILCGYHGILATTLLNIETSSLVEHARLLASDEKLLSDADNSLRNLSYLEILIDSDLQMASGLSSSSALVCGSAVATLLLLIECKHLDCDKNCSLKSLPIDRAQLANWCSKFEHLIGTHGGGMDQAVIMTAQEGYAKHVEFVPKLRCDNVRLPDNTVWLVSHCGVSYPKAATSGYNTRVLETKIGAAMIVVEAIKSLIANNSIRSIPEDDIVLDSTITLGKVMRVLFNGMSTGDIIKFISEKVFEHKNEFTVDEICTRLNLSRQDLVDRFNTSDKFLKDHLEDKLKLLPRCEHVFEEAERVEKFRSICDTTTDISLLGQLMTQSHYSLRDKYECSHPALDRLVSVALDAGALGSRLTGAGWGGCIVTLVESSKCDTVFERLKEVSKFTFRTEPQSGCEIIRITN